MQNTKGIDQKGLQTLLTPSLLSGLTALGAGLLLTAGVLVLFNWSNSNVQQQLLSLQSPPTLASATYAPAGYPAPQPNHNALQNTWPLLAFWGMVGLIVYFIVETTLKFLHNIKQAEEELSYVHAKRDALIKTTLEYLLLRLVIAALWLVFINLFFKRIVPYSIAAAYASAASPRSLTGLLYALLSFVMVVLSVHIHTIFIRLVLRRPRVFA